VVGRGDVKGLTDRQALHSVLSRKENRYLVRQLCWVMSIEGLDTYVLAPRDPVDFDLLVETLRPAPSPMDLDCVIGVRAGIAPPQMCNGLMVPAAEELFDRIMQLTDNAGATDEHRALNYCAMRYPAIYGKAADAFARNASLSGVEVVPSRLSQTRKVYDVIFSYTNRETDVVEKFFLRVDVTEEFPFLVTKLSPYYDR
jgi:hypothetical protein